ncbi:CCHamide precursor [Phthorimaea operculella]|nr:CCHamide precursor [Phthorimaea operculella]
MKLNNFYYAANGGCSAFGHSCFGGHGKRSDSSLMDPAIEMGRRQLGQEETPPHPGYPHPAYSILTPGDDIIPVRDGGVYDHDDSAAREVMKYKLRNIVKHWMEQYRRSQKNDDAYIVDSM